MSDWNFLNDKQLIKTLNINNNKPMFIIVPANFESMKIPLFCDLCNFVMITKEDLMTYQKNNMCEFCHYHWDEKDIEVIKKNPKFKEFLTKKENNIKNKLKIKLK